MLDLLFGYSAVGWDNIGGHAVVGELDTLAFIVLDVDALASIWVRGTIGLSLISTVVGVCFLDRGGWDRVFFLLLFFGFLFFLLLCVALTVLLLALLLLFLLFLFLLLLFSNLLGLSLELDWFLNVSIKLLVFITKFLLFLFFFNDLLLLFLFIFLLFFTFFIFFLFFLSYFLIILLFIMDLDEGCLFFSLRGHVWERGLLLHDWGLRLS